MIFLDYGKKIPALLIIYLYANANKQKSYKCSETQMRDFTNKKNTIKQRKKTKRLNSNFLLCSRSTLQYIHAGSIQHISCVLRNLKSGLLLLAESLP